MEVRREEVEELLGYEITEEDFADAFECAKRKQAYIFGREKRSVVLEHWYLVKLTGEYVESNAFSNFTMDLCRMIRDMEKEHLFNELGAPTDNHILADSAL